MADSDSFTQALRRIAAVLVRSTDAKFILDDLDELLRRDLAAGLPPWRARWRYARNMLASALSIWRARPGRAGARKHRPPDSLHCGVSWLDFKLGFRMLIKYPGLTLVGLLAVSVAVAVGAGGFATMALVTNPKIPLDDADRIVTLENADVAANRMERQILHDFVTWREEVESVEELSAYRDVERNLITGQGPVEPVRVAEISASAFRVTRVAPLLGRFLIEADEDPGAPPVVVISHDVWQREFAGGRDVVGRSVQLGNAQATVIGVMPEGFGFPVNHSLWTPLRLDPFDYERREGPVIRVFGRLAPTATLDEAEAELGAIGRRAAADFPDTHEHLRPGVMTYAQSVSNRNSTWESVGLWLIRLLFVILVVLICANVALLVFARAAAREREIVVRHALGASRRRIIGQLLAEALVLAGVSGMVGLAATRFLLRWWLDVIQASVGEGNPPPFWLSDALTPQTVLFAVMLTLLAAVVMGVLPALKVTGRRTEMRLRQATAGGGGLRFGGIWTAVIVAQVAVAVVFPVPAFLLQRDMLQVRSFDVGFPEEEYLSARLELDAEGATSSSHDTSHRDSLTRFQATVQELERRLTAEPGVAGATFADRLPHTRHSRVRIEVDAGGAAPPNSVAGHTVRSASVAVNYFDVLGAPILSGQGFRSADLGADHGVLVVNQSFVEHVLEGRNPIGRRVRYLDGEEPGRWYEIVGVVRDLGMTTGADGAVSGAGFYHPIAPASADELHIAVHVDEDPERLAPRLRAVAAAVDPSLRLYDIMPLDEIIQGDLRFFGFVVQLLVVVSSIALLLSLAGIYSVMSFTVSRRTREIGIRVALGADARTIALAIFRRPLAQVGFGVLAGGAVAAVFSFGVLENAVWPTGAALLMAYGTLMMGVCMLACVVPTRRALGVEPTEALKDDG